MRRIILGFKPAGSAASEEATIEQLQPGELKRGRDEQSLGENPACWFFWQYFTCNRTMRSAPLILLLLAVILFYGTALAALQGTFGFKEVAFSLILPLILIISAVNIWRIQRTQE